MPEPVPPPQPSSGRGLPQGVRTPKVRTSCDECAAAKVRCSKTKPRCERCITFNIDCVYGFSMKRGRTATKSQHQQPQQQQNCLTAYDVDLHQLFSEDIVFTPWASNGIPGSNGTLQAADYVSDSIMLDNPDAHPSSSLANRSQASSSGYDSLDDLPSLSPWTDKALDTRSASLTSLQTLHSRGDGEQHHDCYETAHCALAALCSQPRSTSPDQAECEAQSPTLNFDDILRTTKDAMNTLDELLNCRCARSPNIALLCASLVTRVIFWHRVAVGSTVSYVVQQSPQRGGPRQQRTLSITSSTLAMGTYVPDDQEQKLMQRVLLLRNLARMGETLHQFRKLGDLQCSLAVALQPELEQTTKDVSSYGESSNVFDGLS